MICVCYHHCYSSCTAICLVETEKNERPRVLVETLMGYCDHFTVLDPQLSVSNVWPPINCSSVIGKPPPRYAVPIPLLVLFSD
jgi:hypothetical protein